MKIQAKDISKIAKERREWVNNEFGKKVSNSHMTNKQKSTLLKRLWSEAKRRFK